MCLTTSMTRAKIAKEDIVVWKVLRSDGFGLAHNLDIDGTREKWKQGFHYYETTPFKGKKKQAHWWTGHYVTTFDIYGSAFHVSKERQRAIDTFLRYDIVNRKLVKMIIPKGALYFENSHEYASSEIIYPKQRKQKV